MENNNNIKSVETGVECILEFVGVKKDDKGDYFLLRQKKVPMDF
jgi:hypothetical protein